MGRGALLALVAMTSCIAPAQTIGAVDEDVEVGTGESGLTTTGTTPGTSSSGTPDDSDSSGPIVCSPPCVESQPCHQARCVDGECLISYRDELCDTGDVCGPLGCVPQPLTCASDSVLLCEDFETEGFAPEWAGGSTGRTSSNAHSGMFAGEVSLMPDERQQLNLDIDPPLAEGTLAIRSFVWVPADPTIAEWVIFHELSGRMNAGSERYSLDLKSMYGLQYVALPGSMSGPPNPSAIPPETWACVELRIQISDTAGNIEIRVNDVVVDSNDMPIDTLPVDGFANVNVGGLASMAEADPYTFLFDDLVIATEPIGCALDPGVAPATGSTPTHLGG
jgi:hypothetical protein